MAPLFRSCPDPEIRLIEFQVNHRTRSRSIVAAPLQRNPPARAIQICAMIV
jgi:hypothetical protein